MARGIDQEKLMERIAKQLGMDKEEVAKHVGQNNRPREGFEDRVLQRQSIINFYRTRIEPKKPEKRQGESALAFKKRYQEWETAYNEWRFKDCKGCGQKFAYAYTYDSVAYCSLDCLDDELRKIGLRVTPGRDPKLRWGLVHPAIVPASALQALKQVHDFEIPDEQVESASSP